MTLNHSIWIAAEMTENPGGQADAQSSALEEIETADFADYADL
jgi:hypothetical protein